MNQTAEARRCGSSRIRLEAGIAVVVLAVMLGLAPVGADEGGIVADLVGMLEAGLSEEIVLDWLETGEKRLQALSAEQMIALRQAGASDGFLAELLERVRASAVRMVDGPDGPTAPEAVSGRGEAERTAAESGSARKPAKPSARSFDEASAGEPVPVSFEIEYVARFEHPDPAWDLFVYLDGIPLTYVTNGTRLLPGRIEFMREIPPGRHVLRVTQERHEERRKRWEHHSRVAPRAFEFELDPGTPASIELEFRQRMLDYDDPLKAVVQQGNRVLDSGRIGGDSERWAPLCEDVLASVPDGKEPRRSDRSRLERCVDWRDLWPGLEVPSRDSLLEAMAEFDFRPVPKGS